MTEQQHNPPAGTELRTYPVLATRNVVIFPGNTIPLNIGRTRSVAAVEAARLEGGYIVAIAQRSDLDGRDPNENEIYRVGTLTRIEKMRGSAEHGYQVLARGVARVRVDRYLDGRPYLAATVETVPDIMDVDAKTGQALGANIKTLAREILALVPADTRQVAELIDGLDDLELLVNICAEHLDAPLHLKQDLLESTSVKGRALRLLELMQNHKETLKLQSEIREKLTSKMSKSQREAILREHLRTIREELGEDDGRQGESYNEKIDKAGMPEEVKKIALDESKRLSTIGQSSPEAHVIRNYLDLLCALPWSKSTDETIDLEAARAVLDGDHYGLDKIKKRIIQHLAVLKLRKDRKGSILLFVGPPGVGKTSLGNSIARALGRKFVRVALGGVRDDAEIRGHRRTYIGSMPGRIIQGIKRAGVNNPVMLLDEIDKLGRGYQGDPAGALLEVLDPEQNDKFADHYLDVPFDLSKTFFIATANTLETIPGPLLDRMEVIDLTGYTTAEKLHIAKSHLIPKQLEAHGMTAGQLRIADEALMRTITHYTREAGVRELDRKIATLVRAMTEKVLEAKEGQQLVIETAMLEDLLGQERFIYEVAERIMPPGVVTGLAWTPQGGEILFIEARTMPGTGKLTLTGQLGEVMKESAQIALSHVRSNLPSFVPGFDYDKKDVHVHVPAGAIPKDGPSAGVTMLTTLASLFTGRSVSPKLAMTGEITLRGSVMPVGGIKEKVIAAHRAGIERIILPKRNQKDVKEIPEDVRAKLDLVFVDDVAELLKEALGLDVSASAVMSASGDGREAAQVAVN
jgi:ATP-dependent Lon protease